MHIAHVPQTIYLADSTIEENIAFGIPKHEIDHERVKQVAAQAQIAKTIEGLPQGYETFVGERGTRLSGGQRQRVMIAMALACRPRLLVADEPTTALDVSLRAQILDLLDDLQKRFGMAVLLITHDLKTVRRFADQVLVMEKGVVVESGQVDRVLTYPNHPYTQKLINSQPPRDVVEAKNLSHSPFRMAGLVQGGAICGSAGR